MKTKALFWIVAFVAQLWNSNCFAAEQKISLALNWKPEPEFGGFYQALSDGLYKKAGLDVEILEGGSATPTPQMLASGKVQFAIVSSEEIILNNERNPKNRLVALFSVFEKAPYMIMAHKKAGVKSLKELLQSSDYQISLQKGLPYVDFLIQKYSPIKAEIVPYSGGIALFQRNQKFAQQGFVTSELLIAENKKLEPVAWLVADEGFNPYIAVLAVQEDYLNKNKDLVQKVVEASRSGWINYLKDFSATNKMMNQKNPSMNLELMNQSTVKMKDFMKFEPLKIGQMKASRWKELSEQMQKMKLISKPTEIEKAFKDF